MLNEKRPLSITDKLQVVYVEALYIAYSLTPKNTSTSSMALNVLEVLIDSIKKYNPNPFTFFRPVYKPASLENTTKETAKKSI